VDIRFTGQNLRVTSGMKEHLEERLPKLEKYAPRIVESHVFLKKVKYLFVAEITVLTKDFRAFGKGSSKDNIFTAMDEAYNRTLKQLKKYCARKKNHHQKEGRSLLRAAQMGEAESELEAKRPKLVRTEDFAPKPMSAEEASLQLRLVKESFLVFLNSSTDRVNVIYKRKDGNHGLIEPQF